MNKSLHIFAQTIKRTTLLIAAVITAVIVLATPMVAQTSGTCGENLTWTLNDSTLTISGTGEMDNWTFNSPWEADSSIRKVVIEDGVTSIGDHAFIDCNSLISINIPNSVISIGSVAFSGCRSLTSITIPNSVTWIFHGTFANCRSLTSIIIPNSVTSIDEDAFHSCHGLTTIDIPNSVISIGYKAFYHCINLTSINISSGVRIIEGMAFTGCNSLTSVNIPSSITRIEGDAFSYCRSLASINVDDGNIYYSSIDGILFNAEKNTIVIYPKGKARTSYTIPNHVTSIGNYAFYGCDGMTSINIPNSVTKIGEAAFLACSGLTSIKLPNSVESIGDNAFEGCSGLTSVNIPNSITSIGNNAFGSCYGLTSINIGNGVKYIGGYAFDRCVGITSVYIKATTPPETFWSFSSYTPVLYVPTGSKAAYQAADNWKNFANIVELDPKDFPDAIGEVADDNGFSIRVEDGRIIVDGVTDYNITDLNGVSVSRDNTLPTGIYIVYTANGKVRKVVVP